MTYGMSEPDYSTNEEVELLSLIGLLVSICVIRGIKPRTEIEAFRFERNPFSGQSIHHQLDTSNLKSKHGFVFASALMDVLRHDGLEGQPWDLN